MHKLCALFAVLSFICIVAVNGQSPFDRSLAQHQILEERRQYHHHWQSIGPTLNGARAESVQLVPQLPGTMYAAYGSGGLWKTTNNGLDWLPIFEGQAAPGIGDVAVAPSNPNIVYVATGESLRKQRNFTMPGNGIYRSNDGGLTWQHKGLAHNWHCGELVVHPLEPNIVMVAAMGKFWSPDTAQGIYRTENGGSSWEKVLYVDDKTRANDVVFAPSDPSIAYASMWANNIDSALMESVYGPTSGIYRSEDKGKTWKPVLNGLPIDARTGRIGLAVSYQNPNKVYALIDNLNNDRTEASEIYRTEDGGQSWHRTHQSPQLFSSVIGWYFADIYCSPDDDEEIYALGVRLAHSLDGGRHFEFLEGKVHHQVKSPAQSLHLDQCELDINPKNPNQLLLANDGGVYSSYDRGKSWAHHNSMATGEFYTMTIEQRPPYRVLAGTQDNATVVGSLRQLGNKPVEWEYLWIDAWSGGDGCVSAFDPDSSNQVYMSMQDGAIRVLNITTQKSKGIRPTLPDSVTGVLEYQFVAPYFISQHSKQLYHAGNRVFRSDDKGDSWTLLSPNLTHSKRTGRQGHAAGALVESPRDPELLYVGMDAGICWSSSDEGQTWHDVSNGLADRFIRSIVPSQHEVDRVYLTMTGLNSDDLASYAYVSEDRGKTWTDVAQSLPDHPVNCILEDPNNAEVLYVGTMRGVYISMDRGRHWQSLGTRLPYIAVADMTIVSDLDQLVVATHGRGLYHIPLAPLRGTMDVAADSLLLLPIQSAMVKRRSTHNDVDLSSLRSSSMYFHAPSEDPLEIVVSNAKGDPIFSKELQPHVGLNQFDWDMVTSERESNHPYFIHYKTYLGTGIYTVLIRQGDAESSGQLTVMD
ncbi:MAG: hypothetical protein KTR24_03595 [Saprospiraceae bacterium]|nr:hypothetical protein [Saprospiraceae bacterium]